MELTTLTDPLTGLGFKALKTKEGWVTIDTAFDGVVTIKPDSSKRYYMVPSSLFEHRDTMTLRECAEYLGVSRMRVSRMCADGNLKSAKVNGALVIDKQSAEMTKEKRND